MTLQPLPAFSDNYIWALSDHAHCLVVDPGEAGPVLAAVDSGLAPPAAILLTHHHNDHIGGVAGLLDRWPRLPVFSPHDDRIPFAGTRVDDGDRIALHGWRFRTIAVPGHTSSHVAYVSDMVDGPIDAPGHLFCGDTLFSLGCGRLFEGSPGQMLDSLDRLAALPPATQVCCGHEYTLANAAFARQVEPDNTALRRRSEEATAMRQAGRPSLPSTLADECAANPFLRIDAPSVQAAVTAWLGHKPTDRIEAFAALRRWKDGFRATGRPA